MKDKETGEGSSFKKRFSRGIILGTGVFLVVASLRFLGVFSSFEWKSWDLRLNWLSETSEASSSIVLLLIDQYSLDFFETHHGLPWPWPREMYSAVVRFCSKGGAKACVFDLMFTENSSYGVEDDACFSEAIREAGNVFLPLFLSKEERESDSEAEKKLLQFPRNVKNFEGKAPFSGNSLTFPVDELLFQARGIGNVQLYPDKDGIYRRLPLLFSYKEFLISSLPLSVAETQEDTSSHVSPEGETWLNGQRIPLDDSGQMVIRYSGPQGTYKSYSIASIINSWALWEEGKPPQVLPEEFKDKIVLVGGSAPGLLDLRPTPFSPVYPGTEIQATAIDNLMNRNFVRIPGQSFALFLIGLFSLLAAAGTSLIRKPWKMSFFFFFCLILPALAAWLGFSSGYWTEFAAPEASVFLSFIGASLLNYSVEGKQRRFIKKAFHHYLSRHVIDQILENPERLHLGGEKKEISSFFSDIAGFTSISERLPPEELVELLNSYLSEMTDIILSSKGTLDKYEGDAIIAFWNAPLSLADHSARACQASLRCQKKLAEINPHFQSRFGCTLAMRIGINSGPAIVGNMGSQSRFDFTAMGDTVNLASRLEGACKIYGVFILAGEETQQRVKEDIITREIDIIRVVGKKNPVRVFEVLGEKGETSSEDIENISRFAEALKAFRSQNWDQAQKLFRKEKNAKLRKIYEERCETFKHSPPPKDWDGVFELKSK